MYQNHENEIQHRDDQVKMESKVSEKSAKYRKKVQYVRTNTNPRF